MTHSFCGANGGEQHLHSPHLQVDHHLSLCHVDDVQSPFLTGNHVGIHLVGGGHLDNCLANVLGYRPLQQLLVLHGRHHLIMCFRNNQIAHKVDIRSFPEMMEQFWKNC